IIHVDCISEVYKTFKLIKGDYGLPLLEVLWKLSYTIDNSDTFSKRGVEVYELNYDWLYSLSQKPGSLYKLKADFGSGHISVFIKCIPPTVEPIAIIKYEGVYYQQEEIISINCKKWEHLFELLDHDPFGEEFINWELASLNGVTIYKTENGTGSKFTLDQM